MDLNNIVTIISAVGFPIVACIGMGWFVKYLIDNNNKKISEITTALNNNTLVVQKLCDMLDNKRE